MDDDLSLAQAGAAGLLALELVTVLLARFMQDGQLDRTLVTNVIHTVSVAYEERAMQPGLQPGPKALFLAVAQEATRLHQGIEDQM
jgi:hypothetical protein